MHRRRIGCCSRRTSQLESKRSADASRSLSLSLSLSLFPLSTCVAHLWLLSTSNRSGVFDDLQSLLEAIKASEVVVTTAFRSSLMFVLRGTMPVLEELDKILAFNNLLLSLKNRPNVGSFTCGIGPVSLIGGEYDSDKKIDDLKLLYRAYVTDSRP